MKKQYFKTEKDWEEWLDKNHDKEKELFLLYYKKHTGKPCISYDDSVETALCYGWIDGLVKQLTMKATPGGLRPEKKTVSGRQ